MYASPVRSTAADSLPFAVETAKQVLPHAGLLHPTLTFLTFPHGRKTRYVSFCTLHIGPKETTWHVRKTISHVVLPVIGPVLPENRPDSTKKGRFNPVPALPYYKYTTFFARKQALLKSPAPNVKTIVGIYPGIPVS